MRREAAAAGAAGTASSPKPGTSYGEHGVVVFGFEGGGGERARARASKLVRDRER